MKPATIANKLPLFLSWLVGLIMIILPFHAFLTVWLASAADHYTLLRLWKEFLLLIIIAGTAYLLFVDRRLREKILSSLLAQLIGLYFLLSLLWGIVAYSLDKVTLKALGFGLVVNLRYLAFFLVIWVIATKSQWLEKMWPKILLIPAGIVILIGLLQRLVLPYDFLRHFGYNESTIFPYQTINYDIKYPRIMSTLRGANPLGAYLILIISAIGVLFLKFKQQRLFWGLFGTAGLLALFFSYSRGAWIGLGLSGLFLAWLTLKQDRSKQLFLGVLALILIGSAVAAYGLRNNPTFENYLFHTHDRSTIEESSNEAHISAFKEGMDDVVTEPLGRGVGTAGPASVYNQNKGRIADNYFVQIAQEVGWLGLIVFLAINFLVVRELWVRKKDNLALILLVSVVGITAVNLVSHAWTDDTLAYIWWGLAGIALAPAILTDRKRK
jgi:hypothetical protein